MGAPLAAGSVPAAMFAVAVTAFVGVDELRSTDDTTPARPATVPAVRQRDSSR